MVSGVLEKMGVPAEEFVMYDGSGLSRMNMVSPYAVARLLINMRESNEFAIYYDSLPLAGVDGTLKRRMRGTAAENNVRAKTGYVGHVRSLSGYVETADGEPVVFSILVNYYTIPTRAVEVVQDKICVLLSNFHR